MHTRFIIPILFCLLLPAGTLAAAAQEKTPSIESTDLEPQKAPVEVNGVVLQGLNKVTGQISRLEGPTGTVMRFGTLEIAAHRCWKSNPEDRPENAALLEISELKPAEAPHRIFLGWMFSSSPGLSGLEHPVYDISVVACTFTPEEEPEAPKEEPKKAKAAKKK